MIRLAASAMVVVAAVVLSGVAAARYDHRLAEVRQPVQPAVTSKLEDRISKAFRDWLGANRIAKASLVVMRDGAVIGRFGFGDRGPDTVVPVASLSKAITAVCIASLVDSGRLAYGDPLAKGLGKFLAFAHPRDVRARSITIEHLLRHQSGLEHDATQGGLPVSDGDSAAVTLARRTLGVSLA